MLLIETPVKIDDEDDDDDDDGGGGDDDDTTSGRSIVEQLFLRNINESRGD